MELTTPSPVRAFSFDSAWRADGFLEGHERPERHERPVPERPVPERAVPERPVPECSVDKAVEETPSPKHDFHRSKSCTSVSTVSKFDKMYYKCLCSNLQIALVPKSITDQIRIQPSRMRRYFKPPCGPCKASKESLVLYSTEKGSCWACTLNVDLCRLQHRAVLPVCKCKSPGDKLRELLEKHGDFKEVEVAVKKYFAKKEKDGRRGRWVTKAYLTDVLKYSKHLGANGTKNPLEPC